MSKFKVGDNVRCTNTRGNAHITVGLIYHISSVSLEGVYILDDISCISFYYDTRFELVVTSKYPNPPHKHRDLIMEWANGAEIESNDEGVWGILKNPKWAFHGEYRIKPTKTEKQLLKEELLVKVKELSDKIKELDNE